MASPPTDALPSPAVNPLWRAAGTTPGHIGKIRMPHHGAFCGYRVAQSVARWHLSSRTAFPWTGRLKSVSLCSIALAAGIALLIQGACYWQLLGLEKQLRNTLAQQWQRYIPENRHSSNVRVWLPKQLQQHSPAPFALLLQIQSGLASFPGLALEGVSYNSQKKSLQLYLYASDESQVQQFIKQA